MPPVYLYRFLPNYLCKVELEKLSLKRLKAFYRKHRHIPYSINDEEIKYSDNDRRFNGEWGTSPLKQVSGYFQMIRGMIEERESKCQKLQRKTTS